MSETFSSANKQCIHFKGPGKVGGEGRSGGVGDQNR